MMTPRSEMGQHSVVLPGVGDMFAALFENASGLIEIRALPSKARHFGPVEDLDAHLVFLHDHRHENLYAGVAARRDDTSGALDNCTTLGVLFIDQDFKTIPETEARARLSAFPLPPSIVVASGGGLHVYWRLEEALRFPDGERPARDILRRLARALGGDLSAAEPARVLRIPGTLNHKYSPPRVVAVESIDSERRYDLAELAAVLPPEPQPSTGAAGPFQMPDEVREGERRSKIFAFARSLRRSGLAEAEVIEAALVVNTTRCRPPLSAAQVEEQVDNAFVRRDRADFNGHHRDEGEAAAGQVSVDEISAPESTAPEAWPTLAPEALVGPLGELVQAVAPFTEADPVAILAHSLVAFGNVIGPDPHVLVGYDVHPARLFGGVVGQTAMGRKGTSWSAPRYTIGSLDPAWLASRVRSGLSSAEGLIYNVRDARSERQPIKQKGRTVDYESVEVDAGEPDKRLLVVESELASVLRRMNREGNTLSTTLRDAWDSGSLSTLTKNSPLRATGAHVSLIAHVTREELRRYLSETEMANGFANRFLWFLVRRARLCPDGEQVPPQLLLPVTESLRRALHHAETVGTIRRDAEADRLWRGIYETLSTPEPGLVGAVLSRAPAQVIRVSSLYAVADSSALIRPVHMMAALAVWDYAAHSARLIFGGLLGDPVADLVLDALRRRGGLTKTQLFDLFGRHRSAAEIGAALSRLDDAGLVVMTKESSGGRPKEVWRCR